MIESIILFTLGTFIGHILAATLRDMSWTPFNLRKFARWVRGR